MCCGGEHRECWPLDALAESVRGLFEENYSSTAVLDASPTSIVERLTGLSDSICEEIVDCWSGDSYCDYPDSDDEGSYEADACYVENESYDNETELRWQHIQEQLLRQSEVISRSTRAFLDAVLLDVTSLSSSEGSRTAAQWPEFLREASGLPE